MTTGADRGWLSEVLRPSVLGGAFFGPAMQVFDVLGFDETWSWREVLFRSVLFAAGMGLFSAVHLRWSAAGRERTAVARAVSTGVLPRGADAEWLGRVTAEQHRLRSDRTGVPGLSALVAVLVAVVTLLPDGPGGLGWLLAAGLALAGGLIGLQQHRRMQTAGRLLVELRERLAHAQGGEPAHGSPLQG